MSHRVDDKLLNTLFPGAAVPLLKPLFAEEQFLFVLRKMGRSKWGTFRYMKGDPLTVIFLDNQLRPEAMLVTMLHEFAHYLVWKNHPPDAKPHGEEWKSAFRTLAIPFLRPEIFAPETLRSFAHYLKNPLATATAHPALYRALTTHDQAADTVALALLPEGAMFVFQGKRFVKGPKRRTRYSCPCPDDGRTYLVNQALWVNPLNTPGVKG